MLKSLILLTKKDRFSADAAAIAKSMFDGSVEHFGGVGTDPLPAQVSAGCDLLISFLSPWIVPKHVLEKCGTAINFHPGSTEYPGIGCYNFAIYEGAAEFGATCHHMFPKVDAGLIIEERRFPMLPSDTVEVLKLRTMVTMLSLYHDIMCLLANEEPLPIARAHWAREPFTRKQLNAMMELQPSMSRAEIERRVRALTYPGYPGPYMLDGDRRAYVPVPDRAPLA